MDPDPTPTATLASSRCRLAVLRRLRDGPATIDSLVSETEATRRTVLRNVKQLENGGWIRKRGTEYHIVQLAETYVRDLLGHVDRGEEIEQLLSLFDRVGFSHGNIPNEVLLHGEVVAKSKCSPARPLDRTVSAIRSGSSARSSVPYVSRHLVQAHREVIANGGSVELVVGPNALERLQSPDCLAEYRDLRDDVYHVQGLVNPIGVVNTDQRTIVLLYDMYGGILGGIFGSFDAITEWGVDFYQSRRREARALETLPDPNG